MLPRAAGHGHNDWTPCYLSAMIQNPAPALPPPAPAADITPRPLRVIRHGGRRNCSWRTLYDGTDLARANAIYDKAFRAIRQGSLVMVDVLTETAIRGEHSGNWRTRP